MKNSRCISVEKAVTELARGNMIILCDHPERENEGDFVVAAELITDWHINTMIREGRGLVCCPIEQQTATRLDLPPQSAHNNALHGTRFTVSIDASHCHGSGISVHDRVTTIRALTNIASTSHDFVRPGHVFPIIAHNTGLAGRHGHTEATVELLKLAQLQPIGVICEIIADSGLMADDNELTTMAKKINIGIITVDEVNDYLININKNKKRCV